MVDEAEKQRLYSEAQSLRGKQGGRGHKKNNQSEGFSSESESFTSQSERFENESPVKPSVAVAVVSKNINTKAELREEAKQVYAFYPRKVGGTKAIESIEKAIERIRSTGADDPVTYLRERIAGWVAKRERDAAAGEFVPSYAYPTTWFNQGRYDDPDNLPIAESEPQVVVNGQLVSESSAEADGWVVVKGDA
jgi:hypothetical protein